MKKKVLAIVGSYRKQGNSTFILNTILNSINDDEIEIVKYHLSDMSISPCKGCFYCRKEQTCIIRDDMEQLIQNIIQADKIIISIPLFMYQISGLVKIMMDRLYPLIKGENGKYTKLISPKDLILIYSQGAPDPSAYEDYLELNKRSFSLLGFNVINSIICPNSNQANAAMKNHDLIAQARLIGTDLIQN